MRSLEGRIVALFIFLILVVQLAAFISIRGALESNARVSIVEELATSERVVQRLLEQDFQRMTDCAYLIAADINFQSAMAHADRNALATMLVSHSAKMHAGVSMLVGTDRQVIAMAPLWLSVQLQSAMLQLANDSKQLATTSAMVVVGQQWFQLVAVPAGSSPVAGRIVLALPFGKKLVADMRQLTLMQVTLLTRNKEIWQVGESSLDVKEADLLAKKIPLFTRSEVMNLQLGDNAVSVRSLALTQGDHPVGVVVLQRSVSEAVAPYVQLQLTLLMLMILGIALSVFGSVLFAKRIREPMRQLSDIAKRLGAGDYTAHVEVNRDDEIGDLAQAFVSMRDGIARREREIGRLAYWDTLTDLPNRAQFTYLLEHAITEARQNDKSCYVLMMDLDRFKHVNDVLGHSFGDVLLKKLAQRLCEDLPGAHLARLGGDEFALLRPDATLQDALDAAQVILAALEKPIALEDQTVDLGAGIGIAGYPDHGDDAEMLLGHVEVAMYAAKLAGGSNAAVYSPEVDKSSQQNLSLLSELRAALQYDQLCLYVQPKLVLGSETVVGLEALVWWAHPTRGLVMPDQFIPFAEQTGFIRQLTRWVLDRAAALCADLMAQGVPLKISVNISTRDLIDQDLPVKFADILTRHRVKTSSFCLEITESAIMDDPIRALQTLERFHAMGVELSIDDFGTGYSSLAYLKRLPVDELKIDKSFVLHMESDADDSKIVKSTIDLGHNMGLRVVAEGVENEAVMVLLTKMGCDQAQGYFISRPMPSEELIPWLAGRIKTYHSEDRDKGTSQALV